MRLTHINKYKFGLGENERYEENISITFIYDINKKGSLKTPFFYTATAPLI